MTWTSCEHCGSTQRYCPDYPAAVDAFPARVRLAATCLRLQRGIGSRAFDNCFEMYDGDALVVSLARLADQDAMVRQGMEKVWDNVAARNQLRRTVEQYAHIPTDRLGRLAAELRANAKARNQLPLSGVSQLDLFP